MSPSKLIPLLAQPAYSPSLTHLIVHPPVLLSHLATAYLTPPPPASSPAKFWGVFLPLSERGYETDRLIFGSGGEGSGRRDEMVVEVLVRGGGDGSGRRRTVERTLEGWSKTRDGFCDLAGLESLRSIWTNKQVDQVCNLFTLSLNISILNLRFVGDARPNTKCIVQPQSHTITARVASTSSSSICP